MTPQPNSPSPSPGNATASMPTETRRPEIKIHIRQHQPQDWPHIAKMYVDMLKIKGDTEEHQRLWNERVRRDTQENLLDITASHNATGGNLWVATMEDVIVGMVGLMSSRDEGSGQVRRMYIDRKYHRLGIGRMLMTRLLQWAKENGFHRVFLTTDATSTQAAGFYTSRGASVSLGKPAVFPRVHVHEAPVLSRSTPTASSTKSSMTKLNAVLSFVVAIALALATSDVAKADRLRVEDTDRILPAWGKSSSDEGSSDLESSTDASTVEESGDQFATVSGEQACGGEGFDYSRYWLGSLPEGNETRLSCVPGYRCEAQGSSVIFWCKQYALPTDAKCGGFMFYTFLKCIEGAVCSFDEQTNEARCLPIKGSQ